MIRPITSVLFALFLVSFAFANGGDETQMQINYFGEQLSFQYHPGLVVMPPRVCAKDKCIRTYYDEMEKQGSYGLLLAQMEQYKEAHQLK